MTFRPLAESDLADLYVWLNRPHLRQFFQKTPVSAAEVAAKYGAYARHEKPTRAHLAMIDGRPFGYLQCYRIADYPAWAALIGETDGIGVDLAILDPALVGKGFGRVMLGLYLREVAFPLFPDETACFVAHEEANIVAWRNSLSLGFRPVRDILEDGVPTRLLALKRSEIPGFLG